jgi:hypothetical protein
VLSAHTLLIAVIFIPYMVMMTSIGIYIYRTGPGRKRSDDDKPPDAGSDDQEDGLPGLPLAA